MLRNNYCYLSFWLHDLFFFPHVVSSVGACLVAGQPFEGLMLGTFPFKFIFKVHIHSDGCCVICTPALPFGVCLVCWLHLLPLSSPPLVSTPALNPRTALQSQFSGALSFGPLENRSPVQLGNLPEISFQGQGRAGPNEGWEWGL